MATKPKSMTKSAVLQEVAAATNLTKKQIGEVLDALAGLIHKQLGKKGPGVFTLPGMLKLTKKFKPATKARQGPHPITKVMTTFSAKPARNVVRARPLKALNDAIK